MGLGLLHFIPLLAYLGFWVMCVIALAWRPRLGFYYSIPFLPYRSMRNHFFAYPLGENMLSLLVICVIIGAIIRGKRLPKSALYGIWLLIGVYLYLSMWMGAALGNAPAPIWTSDHNLLIWKSYMLIPIVFLAASLVVEDRQHIRTVILITAVTLFFIDRSSILESMSRSWASFDEDKRDSGPLAYGANQTAAFFAQYALFFTGFVQFVKRKKLRLLGYGLAALTVFAAMYTFSRGGYLAIFFGLLVLGLLKNRKVLVILGIFLLTWQTVLPTAVQQRITMTENANGQLESSAQERIDLWKESWSSIVHSPIVGNGYATYGFAQHAHGLGDTHNWYVLVMVETGIIGLLMYMLLFQQTMALSYRLFSRASDPLYRGLGLGLVLAMCTSVAANCFGDRWTYLEITSLLWVLIAVAIRAEALGALEPNAKLTAGAAIAPIAAKRLPQLHPTFPLDAKTQGEFRR